MGRRGPAPTPTNILKLRGSTLVTRQREAREVQAPTGVPDPPAWLDADARAAWDELLPMLDGMGVLSRLDGHALGRYCHLWARWRKAEEFIRERGEMYPIKDDAGQVKCFQQWPQVAIAHRLAQHLTRLEQEFGMTPSARARLQLAPQGQEKPSGKARFFNVG
ncbi:MAG: phage terminase small subunit P27 family [Phycisphaerales bacterium]|nr:phage terminase small subunit P27 family [Phycisphaerales bacterium]